MSAKWELLSKHDITTTNQDFLAKPLKLNDHEFIVTARCDLNNIIKIAKFNTKHKQWEIEQM